MRGREKGICRQMQDEFADVPQFTDFTLDQQGRGEGTVVNTGILTHFIIPFVG